MGNWEKVRSFIHLASAFRGKVLDEPNAAESGNMCLYAMLLVLDFILCVVRSDSPVCLSEKPAWQ